MDNIEIRLALRLEEPADYRAVEELTRETFWNLYTLGATEHYMVHCLRESTDCIKSLCFVATIDEQIVGSIFYSHSKITDANGVEHPTITFAPVSVDPKHQGLGIGSKLINHSLSIALKEEHKAVIILGDPNYYKRFGFIGSKAYNVVAGDGNYYKSLLALELKKGYLESIQGVGTFSYSPVFNVTPEGVEEFDKTFPPKIKVKTKTQENFEKTAYELDE